MISIFGPYDDTSKNDLRGLFSPAEMYEMLGRTKEPEKKKEDLINRNLTISILNLAARNLDETGKQIAKQFVDIIKEIPSAN